MFTCLTCRYSAGSQRNVERKYVHLHSVKEYGEVASPDLFNTAADEVRWLASYFDLFTKWERGLSTHSIESCVRPRFGVDVFARAVNRTSNPQLSSAYLTHYTDRATVANRRGWDKKF